MNYAPDFMDKLTSLAKRRGFVFPSAEIYGGLAAVWDYGPLGALMKQNLRKLWLERFVTSQVNIVPIESALLTNREVFVASGHEGGFTDPLVECRLCHERFRADHEIPKAKDHEHDLTEAKPFNLMFKTHAGPVEETANLVYLRPETAQGMFVNFKLVAESMRLKPPFGIAQIGKAFRNEITVGNFIFRLRELEIMEIEYFVKPGQDEVAFTEWQAAMMGFVTELGLDPERLRWYEHPKEKLSHYSKRTADIEFAFPFGWGELWGLANRTDFDLKQHSEHSGKDLSWFDEETKERFFPYVVEPALGLDRLLMTLVINGYHESDGTDGREKGEVVLKLHPRVAPITAAVFPLVKKEGLPEIAHTIVNDLRTAGAGVVQYDESGSIGRRYRRQDEIGTPFCITVDFETKEQGSVTVRHRDTQQQDRVPMDELAAHLEDATATWR
ncbi:glycine--tRNA ligase [Candidatus Berkelbacteria bacterium]|nr:glycine--tRNA ligase [Candidatus Berkelbacteria bacterium]